VHQKVDGDWNPLDGCQADQLSIAKESSGAVVVGVEEGQRLLLEEQENRVEELEVFVQVVELVSLAALRFPRNDTLT
jgi:hypothetical protein